MVWEVTEAHRRLVAYPLMLCRAFHRMPIPTGKIWHLLVVVLFLQTSHAWATSECSHKAHHGSSFTTSHINETIRLAAAPHSALMIATADRQVLVGLFPLVVASLSLTTHSRQLANSLLIIVPSQEDLELCLAMHSPCHLDNHTQVPLVPVPDSIETAGWQGLKVARASWRRADYVNHVISMGIGVFMVDLDMLILGDPYSLLRSPTYSGLDFFAQAEHGDPVWTELSANIDIGFCYFASSPASKELVAKWMANRSRWDQGWLQELLKEKAIPGLKWKAISNHITYSRCHPQVGSGTKDHTKERVKTHSFYLEYFQYLLQNKEPMNDLITFHAACCEDYPTHLACKSMLLSLALHAYVGNA